MELDLEKVVNPHGMLLAFLVDEKDHSVTLGGRMAKHHRWVAHALRAVAVGYDQGRVENPDGTRLPKAPDGPPSPVPKMPENVTPRQVSRAEFVLIIHPDETVLIPAGAVDDFGLAEYDTTIVGSRCTDFEWVTRTLRRVADQLSPESEPENT